LYDCFYDPDQARLSQISNAALAWWGHRAEAEIAIRRILGLRQTARGLRFERLGRRFA